MDQAHSRTFAQNRWREHGIAVVVGAASECVTEANHCFLVRSVLVRHSRIFKDQPYILAPTTEGSNVVHELPLAIGRAGRRLRDLEPLYLRQELLNHTVLCPVVHLQLSVVYSRGSRPALIAAADFAIEIANFPALYRIAYGLSLPTP